MACASLSYTIRDNRFDYHKAQKQLHEHQLSVIQVLQGNKRISLIFSLLTVMVWHWTDAGHPQKPFTHPAMLHPCRVPHISLRALSSLDFLSVSLVGWGERMNCHSVIIQTCISLLCSKTTRQIWHLQHSSKSFFFCQVLPCRAWKRGGKKAW